MRGDLTLIMLETIQLAAGTAADILDALTYVGRTAHYKRLRHIYEKSPQKHRIFEKQIERLKDRRRMNKLISQLKNDGLVAQNINKTLALTNAGAQKLNSMITITQKRYYEIKKSNELKIVVFDIPEKESAHRHWLRKSLKALEFSMLQKSVWTGNIMLPQEFIEALHEHGIEKFVEIFVVTKRGTLEQIR